MSQALAIAPSPVSSPEPAPLAKTRPDFSVADWHAMRDQATTLVRSGFLPRAVDTPEKAIAIIQTGRELGIGPMQALRAIHIIDGKPVMAAELIAGLVLARIPGATLRVVKTTDAECVVHAARPGQETTEFRWTMQDATRAKLTGKQNWQGYPRAMLRNRVIAEAARAIFPDATMGLYDPDELGAVTTPTGEIVSAPPRGQSVASSIMGDEPPEPLDEGEPHPMARLQDQLTRLETLIAGCSTYQEALTLRAALGSKARPQEALLLRELQEYGPERKILSGAEYRELTKIWTRCDRKLGKVEKELATSAEASFTDEGDERQPGEDG